MSKTTLAIIFAVVVLGGYFSLKFFTKPAQQQPSQTSAPATAQNVVTYMDSGFVASTLNIKVGDTVTFKNGSSQAMWVASAMHPTHMVYGGTSLTEHCPDTAGVAFDACTGTQPGSSWSFTFTKAGSWKYHNHLNPQHFGAIVVE